MAKRTLKTYYVKKVHGGTDTIGEVKAISVANVRRNIIRSGRLKTHDYRIYTPNKAGGADLIGTLVLLCDGSAGWHEPGGKYRKVKPTGELGVAVDIGRRD